MCDRGSGHMFGAGVLSKQRSSSVCQGYQGGRKSLKLFVISIQIGEHLEVDELENQFYKGVHGNHLNRPSSLTNNI